ncbi:MAG: hypothetical protein HY914_18510 [Desulfomonile tiedjei]|nr:hypothetical protein [Desulfomonile tiedjei]
MIESRFYNVAGVKWEARFFRKGEEFPDTDRKAPRQGVWARPMHQGWDRSRFVADSWRFVNIDPDTLYLGERVER